MPGKGAQHRKHERRILEGYIQLLERRISHLESLLPNYRGRAGYIRAEIPALKWAVELMRQDIQAAAAPSPTAAAVRAEVIDAFMPERMVVINDPSCGGGS